MKPSRATLYLILFSDFATRAIRARDIGGESLLKLSRLRAENARLCLREWHYHTGCEALKTAN